MCKQHTATTTFCDAFERPMMLLGCAQKGAVQFCAHSRQFVLQRPHESQALTHAMRRVEAVTTACMHCRARRTNSHHHAARAIRELSSSHVAGADHDASPSASRSTTHFGYQQVPETSKKGMVEGVFSSVARDYDTMNDLMSAGVHRLWKDHFVGQLGIGAALQAGAPPPK